LTATQVLKRKGYWRQRAEERLGNPLQGNQEHLVVKDKVESPPGELGVGKSSTLTTTPLCHPASVEHAGPYVR